MSDHPPLRIAVTCLSGYGGSTVIASELAAHLAERGHRVWLVSARRPGRARDVQGLSFVSVQAPAYPALEQAPFGLALAGTLVRLTRVHQLDLVHAHYAIPYAPAAWMARHALGAHVRRPALVATLHGSDVTHLAQANVYQEITRAALLAHEARTAPSRFLAAEARRADYLCLWLDCDREGENICFEVIQVCAASLRRRLFPGQRGPCNGSRSIFTHRG